MTSSKLIPFWREYIALASGQRTREHLGKVRSTAHFEPALHSLARKGKSKRARLYHLALVDKIITTI
jgi:hypothetical protein